MRQRVVSVLAAILAAAWPSVALAFHAYSIDEDNGDPGNYSGVRVVRNDEAVNGSVNNDCAATFDSPIVYEPIWVVMDSSSSNWVEIGSAYKTCSEGTIYFWYGWWNQSGVYTGSVFTQTFGPALSAHTFTLTQTSDNVYHFYVDVTDFYNSRAWSTWGDHVEGGLESYDASAKAASQTYTLSDNLARNGWQNVGSCATCPIVDGGMTGSLSSTQPWILTASEP